MRVAARVNEWTVQLLGGKRRLVFPTSTVVQLHPVVLPIFNFPCVLQGLSEEVSQIVIIGSVLETEVANVGQILVEFICNFSSQQGSESRGREKGCVPG